MDGLLQFSGRLHPILVHLPIGSLVTLLGLEFWARARRRPLGLDVRRLVAFLTAAGATLAAVAGWNLSLDGYSGDALTWHRATGIAFAVAALGVWITSLVNRGRAYRVATTLATLLAVVAGHLGAEMTHGSGYLTKPFESAPASTPAPEGTEPEMPRAVVEPQSLTAPRQAPSEPTAPAIAYASHVAPVLSGHCYACHGPNKQKSGFAMHEPELLVQGGYGGEPIVPGDAAQSELVRRMRLPLEHEDHMPPAEKPQPSPQQIADIEAWIDAGASF